ncbi:MAG: hypothetical protein WBO31_14725 [Saprospiraceae bacterium]
MGLILSITKFLLRPYFKRKLKQIAKEIENDPNIQSKIQESNKAHDELKYYINDRFCKKFPWHHMCKERENLNK